MRRFGTNEPTVQAILFVLLLGVVAGCSVAPRRGEFSDTEAGADAEIRADAYAFNARAWRDGKPTTFKLEVYHTDTLIGLSGTGYLGKGALKGWISEDSIKVYFPSSREILIESLADLRTKLDCPPPLARADLMKALAMLPDSLGLDNSVSIGSNYDDEDKPEFTLAPSETSCNWRLDIEYDRDDGRWRVDRFEFEDGEETRLRGERARYKHDASVPASRFRLIVPPGAIRISL